MRMKYLLGVTTDNEFAFCEFELRGDGEFSCSFDTVYPHKVSEIDTWELADNYLGCLSGEDLYDLCYDYECTPQELNDEFVRHHDLMELMDCSLYPEIIDVDGEDWVFESGSCGQHDLRDCMLEIIDEDAFNFLIKTWDEYHLQPIPQEVFDTLVEKIDASCVNDEEWIANYLKE